MADRPHTIIIMADQLRLDAVGKLLTLSSTDYDNFRTGYGPLRTV